MASRDPGLKMNPHYQWMRRARKCQLSYYNSLGNRVFDKIENKDFLLKKISFGIYGVPTVHTDDSLTYEAEQLKVIDSVKNKIISLWTRVKSTSGRQSESFPVHLACVYVYLRLKEDDYKEGIDVLFRIPKTLDESSNDYLFIDANCRTYNDWNDYLHKNKLPKCDMCYPLNGVYHTQSGIVAVNFKESPRCNWKKSVIYSLDVTTSVLSLGATGVNVAALAIPVAAPFVWGATATIMASSAYNISRNVSTLIDSKQHKESLSLSNPESRRAWIGVAGSTLGFASAGGTALLKRAVESEQIISNCSVVTLRIINISTIAINGIGMVNCLINIVTKYLNDGTLERDDLIQFSCACLFFLNAIVSLNVADRLIKDIALCDLDNLFNSVKNSPFDYVRSAIEFSNSNQYNVLRLLVCGVSSRFLPNTNLTEIERVILQLLENAYQLITGNIDLEKFVLQSSEVLKLIWMKFRDVTVDAIKEAGCILKNVDWRSYIAKPRYKPFANSGPDIAQQFCITIHKTINHCGLDQLHREHTDDILNLINEFNARFSDENGAAFLNKSKFICERFIKEFDSMKEDYELNFDIFKSYSKTEEVDIRDYDQDSGVLGDRNVYFFKNTLGKLLRENGLMDAVSSYRNVSDCLVSDRDAPCMETSTSCHYVFSEPPGCRSLTEQQYYEKVKNLTGYEFNNNNSVTLSRENVVLIQPNDTSHHIKVVIFYISFEANSIMGIVTILKNENARNE